MSPSSPTFDPEVIFGYHAPENNDVVRHHEHVRSSLRSVAVDFLDKLPDCPERDRALRSLQDAMHWANSAVAQHQTPIAR